MRIGNIRRHHNISAAQSRLFLVHYVELAALFFRYLFLAVVLYLAFSGRHTFEVLNLTILVGYFAFHNLFAHWVIFARQHRLFFSPLNFAIHFTTMSMVTVFLRAHGMELCTIYLLFLIGYGAYSRSFRWTFLVASLCGLGYVGNLAYNDALIISNMAILHLLSIFTCGFLVGAATRAVSQVEYSLAVRAQALLASEAKLRTILDSTGDPLIVFDVDENITETNEEACSFLGISRSELIGQKIRSFIFDDGTLPDKMRALRTSGEYHGEEILLDVNGEERNIKFYMRSFVLDDRLYFVCALHDITEQKNLQENTRISNLNLEKLNLELSQLNKLKTGFLMDIPRNLRSPLATVYGYIEILLNNELGSITPEQREALTTCYRNIQRVFSILDEMPELETSDSQDE